MDNDCKKCSNSDERKLYTESGLCSRIVSKEDGLPVRCVGPWAKEKITRLEKYFQMFSIGMYKKWNINYIEICSGPGICYDYRKYKEFYGSSLSIIKNTGFNRIEKALFIDNNEKVINTLNKRISLANKSNAQAVLGDYTNRLQISKIIKENLDVNSLSLNLTFIDPTDCSVPFSTIKELKKLLTKNDLIINIAIGTDFNRNCKNIIKKPNEYLKLKNKYESFLNNQNFFNDEIADLVKNEKKKELRKRFVDRYKSELKNIGYEHFAVKRVKNFYILLFASSNPKGLEFWEKSNQIEPKGTRNLFKNE